MNEKRRLGQIVGQTARTLSAASSDVVARKANAMSYDAVRTFTDGAGRENAECCDEEVAVLWV